MTSRVFIISKQYATFLHASFINATRQCGLNGLHINNDLSLYVMGSDTAATCLLSLDSGHRNIADNLFSVHFNSVT